MAQKTITINLGHLVNQIHIGLDMAGTGTEQAKQEMQKLLLAAVNDATFSNQDTMKETSDALPPQDAKPQPSFKELTAAAQVLNTMLEEEDFLRRLYVRMTLAVTNGLKPEDFRQPPAA